MKMFIIELRFIARAIQVLPESTAASAADWACILSCSSAPLLITMKVKHASRNRISAM